MDLKTYIAEHGGQTGFARLLGITQGAVSQWLKKRVPAERVLEIERLTGGLVTRHELRPDLYPSQTVDRRTSADRRRPPKPTGGLASAEAQTEEASRQTDEGEVARRKPAA